MHLFPLVVLILGCFGLLTSTVFLGLVVVASLRFAAARKSETGHNAPFTPRVSVLKPLHGNEPGLETNLRGFFAQQYPTFELLFCARSADDAGLAIARSLMNEYPDVPARILVSGQPGYVNAKVYSIEKMAGHASYDLLLISDSDVRVGHGYLREVVRPFADPKVGLVTCLYRGVALQRGIWARLEAVGMSIEMTSGAVVSAMLAPVEFALGPTMAVRRQAVAEIGGFGVLGPYCSDDFLLGNWVARAGWQCRLSHHIVEHMVLHRGFLGSIRHQVRWMKSTRASLPKGHFGTGLTFSIPYGILACAGAAVLRHPWLALGLLSWAVVNRIVQATTVGKLVVREQGLIIKAVLWVLRDLMGFLFWAASYTNRRILWRGEVFQLGREGKMHRVTP